jgi:hypothetical protein
VKISHFLYFFSSGFIDKEEFCAGFEETLCKGESRGFGGMGRKISISEHYGEAEARMIMTGRGRGEMDDDEEEMDEFFEGDTFSSGGIGNNRNGPGGSNFPKKKPKPPRLTKNQTMKMPPQMTLDIPWFVGRNKQNKLIFVQIVNYFLSKEEVLQLYEELQSSGVPQIMSRFEEVVGNLCR